MNREKWKAKAKALVERMTAEEAISQLQYDAPAIDRLSIPAYNWWNEALHGVARGGVATGFPQAIGLAATFDAPLLRELGEVAAAEARAKYAAAVRLGDRGIYKGLTFWSPNVNIYRDPRWGRGQETYGEDPFLTSRMGVEYVRGLQGEGEGLKTAACAKHFAAHSGPESLRHGFDATVSRKDLFETYLPAFRALVREAGVEAVMGAYNRVNGEPSCASETLIRDILRGEWGFAGHFVSDCGAIGDIYRGHRAADSPEAAAAMALKAGCDLNCGTTYVYLRKALAEGLVSEAEIRQAAVRLFTARYALGILDGGDGAGEPYSLVECPEHMESALKASREACVLLKNDGTLPLKAESLKTLGVIGPNADSRRALMGNYHGTSSRYITLLQGLQTALDGRARCLYSEGCHLYADRVESLGEADDRLYEAVTVARESDAVVLALGLDETLEGEEGDAGCSDASGDRRDLLLPEAQMRLARAVLAEGKPTVICLLAGGAVDLQDAGEKAGAVLMCWYPGPLGGKAVAEMLLGAISPSGKLPVTFYRNEQLANLPGFTDYSMAGRAYRHIDFEPLYPFGYGLTYGDVYVSEASARREGGAILVEAVLRNEGGFGARGVAQVYVRNEGGSFAPRNARLCAFQSVFCPAGGEARAALRVPAEALLAVNEAGKAVPDGAPVLFAGVGQPDARTLALTGRESVRLEVPE